MKFVGLGCLGLIAAIWAAPSLHMNLAGAVLIVAVRLSFRHGFISAHRGDRVVVESHFRDDSSDAVIDMPDFSCGGMDGPGLFCDCAVGGRDRVRGGFQRRRHVAGFEDGLSAGGYAAAATDRHIDRRGGIGFGAGAGSDESQ